MFDEWARPARITTSICIYLVVTFSKYGNTLAAEVHQRHIGSNFRFSVNLHSGSAQLNEHMGSVPLHVNPRFDEGKIVLNSYQGGQWGEEERVKNPFTVGEPFDLRIRVHDDKYEISANQKEIAEFKHRFPLKTVDHISIDGGVSLKGVHWGGRYFQLPYTTEFPVPCLLISLSSVFR